MALYWSGARVQVRYEKDFEESERDYPEDTIVIVMRPGQEEDPSFARVVRHVVALRTFEHELDDDGCGGRTDEPEGRGRREKDECGGRDTCEKDDERAVFEAERRFVEALLAEDADVCDEGLFGWERRECQGEAPFSMRELFESEGRPDLDFGPFAGRAMRHPVQIFIGHCEEVVIGG